MNIIADLCIIPMQVGLSLSPYIAECEKVLKAANVKASLHAFGTNLEGEWDDVMAAVKRCHEKMLEMGAARIHSTLRIGIRTDKTESMEDRVRHVVDILGQEDQQIPAADSY